MGKGHVGLVEYVSIIRDSLDANMNYSHRQIFGTLPHNLDEEDLVNPQVSSLNLLKAQRARKTANTGKVANAPSAKHTASVRTGHGVAMASAQHSSTPKARDPLQSSSSEKCAQPSEREDQSWNFEDDQSSLPKHLPSRHRATASGDPGQRKVAPRRHPSPTLSLPFIETYTYLPYSCAEYPYISTQYFHSFKDAFHLSVLHQH